LSLRKPRRHGHPGAWRRQGRGLGQACGDEWPGGEAFPGDCGAAAGQGKARPDRPGPRAQEGARRHPPQSASAQPRQ